MDSNNTSEQIDINAEQINSNVDGSNNNQTNKEKKNIHNNTKEMDNAPVLPLEEEEETNRDDIMSMDVQKELEAKFDELFGSFDDDNN